MARRGIPIRGTNWYLSEWMDRLGVSQAEMSRRTDWSKATASQLYTGKQDYSPPVVKAAALALKCEDWELLMPYDKAMALRRIQASAKQIVLAADNTEKTGTNN